MKQVDSQHLYRYQPFNVQTMKVFTLNEVYFCSPKELNDPFDCKVDFTFGGCTDKDIQKFLEKGLKELNKEAEIDKSFEYYLSDKIGWEQNVKKQAVEILQPERNMSMTLRHSLSAFSVYFPHSQAPVSVC